ncbi:guanylate kinase [Nodularia spumigena CS-584]|uniref:Guanylate kinase n=1 Tax=Nodularia spumigena UHCC 0060 TaxID=3110300 RepID=A0ABU5UN43_NODSP|nr:guanylate kinase [Nodularia spumigena]AHJ30304.1 guanylate kinase [Nodularia spumigena CCY9414]MDB9384685.1 guanylate kinase [Nodularia spumigena CS-584]MEA5525772.1 guanylate kinase [Nodularia spumigena UHCC 0143]MEA5558268.1 guanylate kinase [Nodularia spumigena CH309]MEA5607522.1 guanylate kinase [Nodularia spumigena UHCC 0060]
MTNEFVARVTENLSNSHGTADVVQIGVGLLTVQILDLGFRILELVFFRFEQGCYAYSQI